MNGIKSIIFDLGGVIIDIEPQKTYEAFGMHIKDIPKMSLYLHDLFHQLETGKIDTSQFLQEAKKEWNLNLPDKTIIDALNAMLGSIPEERVTLIHQLNARYDTYLLSNTNAIHFNSVQQILEESTTFDSFDALFKKTYYSHIVGLRKPDVRIFELVLKENNLVPAETLFLDDIGENLKSASEVGIQTIKVSKENGILEILKDF